ncbi:MAG TPA: hypothetical protein DES72_14960, partial [Gammaproteobacteria bacterium]|nr:hypothetical protein [Gammaproteobacteria bacterium]
MKELIESWIESGEIQIVEREVDPRFECAAVIARSQHESDRPILFRNIKGSTLPVASNLFGSRQRLSHYLGAEEGNFCQRWATLMKNPVQPVAILPEAEAEFRAARLDELPQLTYHGKDAAP